MKQHYCFLERFNNYFNRKIIKYETLLEYQNNSKSFFIPENKDGSLVQYDFNPNDNVMTEIIENDVPFDPDYFLLLDDEQNIVQRWFVLEQKRNRKGQWLYTLRRDVVSDNLDTLEDAPIFVHKGMLQEDDPFIVNSEGMSLNQIKKNEILLKDKSKTGWAIGYIAKNSNGQDVSVQSDARDVNFPYITLEEIEEDLGLPSGSLSDLVNIDDDLSTPTYFSREVNVDMNFEHIIGDNTVYNTVYNRFSPDFENILLNILGPTYSSPLPSVMQIIGAINLNNYLSSFANAVKDNKATLLNDLPSIFGRSYFFTKYDLEALKAYQGKYIRFNGKYYTLNFVNKGSHTSANTGVDGSSYTSLTNITNQIVALSSQFILGTGNNKYREVNSNEDVVYLQLSLVTDSLKIPQLNMTLSSGRNVTEDQEFDIIAFPLSCEVTTSDGTFQTVENYARRIISALAIELDAQLYDLQLLPYCPVQELIDAENHLEAVDLQEHIDFDYITKNFSDIKKETIPNVSITFTQIGGLYAGGTATVTLPVGPTQNVYIQEIKPVGISTYRIKNIQSTVSDADVSISFDVFPSIPTRPDIALEIYYVNDNENVNCGIMFYVQKSTFSFNIEEKLEVNESKKVVSNCYLWRLVSPNYQGAFEFNIAKNGGTVELFNVFCTYKPYTPVIKVAPNFDYLYGYEFQDNRGLICAGDFSLPRINSAWESYELNNKNYQNIFNRDIQHLDFMQSIEMRNQLVSGAVGIVSDTAKGAGAGAYVGGGVGAVIGGTVGALASSIGYGIDVDTLARTQRENRQLAIDKFNYQLGNIKALPYTLTKVGSFDVISKIFPFIEEYQCSDKELEAFKNKIKYESMTVMRIGTLNEFKAFNNELNYFKGELIRNDTIADDPHTLNAIYEELLKGVYI